MTGTSHRWVFGAAAFAYAAFVLSLLPWASQPGYSTPYLIGIYGVAICAADLCTVLFLVRQYRHEGQPFLLALTAAYLFSACLVLPVALSFPDAFGSGRLIGHDTTSTFLFLSWRIGCAVLLLLGVLLGIRTLPAARPEARMRYVVGIVLATAVVAGAFFLASMTWHIAPLVNGKFNPSSFIGGWLVVALSLAGVVLIFATRSHVRPIFGWLALMLTASVADMTLSTLSGARYSLGWYVSRCSTVIASYLLLAYLAAEFARELRHRRDAARKFAYVGAVALVLCAVLLRYFMLPWVPAGLTYTSLYGAVAVAVWMGGWRPGLLAAVLGYLLAKTFATEPVGVLVFNGIPDIFGLLLYALSCALIIALGHNMRAARVRFERADELFRKSQEAAIQGYSMLRALRDENGKIIDFTIQYVNPRGAALAKRSAQAVLGRRLTEVLPGIVRAGVYDSFCKVTESGVPIEVEVQYEQDGISGWFRNMIVKVEDGVAISYFDISQTKRLERELAQRAYQLERADSNKSQFLATLSHELRNPLAPLRNGLAILKRRFGAGGADMLAMMDRQLHQMVRLVDDLLDVSRIDRGKIDLRRERVTVDSVVSSAIETARPSIDTRSQELVVHFAQRALLIEGDPVRLAQIVSNLLINAAKFTPQRGRIDLSMRATESQVEIVVRDNGVGIDAEHLPRVFDIFVQFESAEGGGGLGLGLALVKSLAELHNGSVEARSEGRGKGAEFIVRLPLAGQAAEAPPAPLPAVLSAKGHRVLVVDDNEDAARTLGELLATNGHQVAVYFKASDAFTAAETFLPEVAFVDLNMPDMDGFELARRLREAPWSQGMRLVAVTGMGRESDVARSREVGFDAHLTKPADPERILELAELERNGANTVLQFPRAGNAKD